MQPLTTHCLIILTTITSRNEYKAFVGPIETHMKNGEKLENDNAIKTEKNDCKKNTKELNMEMRYSRRRRKSKVGTYPS